MLTASYVIGAFYYVVKASLRLWATQIYCSFPALTAGYVMTDSKTQHNSHEEADIVCHHSLHKAKDHVRRDKPNLTLYAVRTCTKIT